MSIGVLQARRHVSCTKSRDRKRSCKFPSQMSIIYVCLSKVCDNGTTSLTSWSKESLQAGSLCCCKGTIKGEFHKHAPVLETVVMYPRYAAGSLCRWALPWEPGPWSLLGLQEYQFLGCWGSTQVFHAYSIGTLPRELHPWSKSHKNPKEKSFSMTSCNPT